MMSFFYNNKAAVALAAVSAAQALLNNYWIFTRIPMVADNQHDVAGKFFYLVGQLLLSAAGGAIIGTGVDHIIDLHHRNNENTALLNRT